MTCRGCFYRLFPILGENNSIGVTDWSNLGKLDDRHSKKNTSQYGYIVIAEQLLHLLKIQELDIHFDMLDIHKYKL